MNTIGETIAELRKKQGLTQEALSALIGVSPQAVSKWENNANMPDIGLLPLLADIFRCSVDDLFGRGMKRKNCHPDQILDRCCESMLETIAGSTYDPEQRASSEESFEKYMEYYREKLRSSDRQRTAAIQGNGVVYYREKLGGLVMKKPQNGWREYFENEGGREVLKLLSDREFCRVLAELCGNHIVTFTLAFLCKRCGVQDSDALAEKLHQSGLFYSRKVHVDNQEIMLYECASPGRMSLLFAVMAFAAEYAGYEDSYICYYGCGMEEFLA